MLQEESHTIDLLSIQIDKYETPSEGSHQDITYCWDVAAHIWDWVPFTIILPDESSLLVEVKSILIETINFLSSQGSALSQRQMLGSNPDSPYIQFPASFCLGRLINNSCPVPAGLSAVVYKVNPLVHILFQLFKKVNH